MRKSASCAGRTLKDVRSIHWWPGSLASCGLLIPTGSVLPGSSRRCLRNAVTPPLRRKALVGCHVVHISTPCTGPSIRFSKSTGAPLRHVVGFASMLKNHAKETARRAGSQVRRYDRRGRHADGTTDRRSALVLAHGTEPAREAARQTEYARRRRAKGSDDGKRCQPGHRVAGWPPA